MEPLIKLREATNRNTRCHWVQVFGVSVLFSYKTAMAFSSPVKGSFCRKHKVSRTTRKHMRETGVDNYFELEDDAFEHKLNEAIMHRVIADKDLMMTAISIAVADKLVPERA